MQTQYKFISTLFNNIGSILVAYTIPIFWRNYKQTWKSCQRYQYIVQFYKKGACMIFISIVYQSFKWAD